MGSLKKNIGLPLIIKFVVKFKKPIHKYLYKTSIY